jgi:hypothetical protein
VARDGVAEVARFDATRSQARALRAVERVWARIYERGVSSLFGGIWSTVSELTL